MHNCNHQHSGMIVPITVKRQSWVQLILTFISIAQEHVQLPINHIVTIIKYQIIFLSIISIVTH